MRRFTLQLCTVLCLIAVPIAGAAQDAAAVDETLDAEARALFEAGTMAFSQGRFDNALEHFNRAYELSKRPKLLYNVGTAADRLRKDDQALAAFEKYLEALPEADNHAEVESRIEVLRAAAQKAEDEAAPAAATKAEPQPQVQAAPEPKPEPEPTPGDGGPGALPWILTIGGGVVALGGAGLAIAGKGRMSNAQDAEDGTPFADVEADATGGESMATAGVVALGVGAAVAIVGVVWLLSSGGGSEDRQVALGASPGGLLLRGTF